MELATFQGPTEVGKKELTVEFARYVFGSESVFRFDISEFLYLDSVKLFMGNDTSEVFWISSCRCSMLHASRSPIMAPMTCRVSTWCARATLARDRCCVPTGFPSPPLRA